MNQHAAALAYGGFEAETLTASIAHEVNQPLHAVMTNASTCLRMLAADPPDIEGAAETARRALRDANRASDVVARMRGLFARKPAVTEEVDLNQATLEVLAELKATLQTSRVAVVVELAPTLPRVIADRVQLKQVIANLLRNASEAMAEVIDRHAEVVVRTRIGVKGTVDVTVKDSGTGFKATDAARLFEPFFSTRRTGMGFGLALSRCIVESHGGRLWARRNAKFGATFGFSLPLDGRRS